MPKMRFLDILVVLRLDLGHISFNLGENALAARQLAFLATKLLFLDEKVTYVFRLLDF